MDSCLAFENNQRIITREYFINVFFISVANYMFLTDNDANKALVIILSNLMHLFSIVFGIIKINALNTNVKDFLDSNDTKTKLGEYSKIDFFNNKTFQLMSSEILFSITINVFFIVNKTIQDFISKNLFLQFYQLNKYYNQPQEFLNCHENSYQISIIDATKEDGKKLYINKTLSQFLFFENNQIRPDTGNKNIYTKIDQKTNHVGESNKLLMTPKDLEVVEKVKVSNNNEEKVSIIFNPKTANIYSVSNLNINNNNNIIIDSNFPVKSANLDKSYEEEDISSAAAKKNLNVDKSFFIGYNSSSSIRNFAESITAYAIEDVFRPFFDHVRNFNDLLISLKRIKAAKARKPYSTSAPANFTVIREEKSSNLHLNIMEKSNYFDNIKLEDIEFKSLSKEEFSKKEENNNLELNSFGNILSLLTKEFINVGYFMLKKKQSIANKNYLNSCSDVNTDTNNNYVNIDGKNHLNTEEVNYKKNWNNLDQNQKDIIIEENNNCNYNSKNKNELHKDHKDSNNENEKNLKLDKETEHIISQTIHDNNNNNNNNKSSDGGGVLNKSEINQVKYEDAKEQKIKKKNNNNNSLSNNPFKTKQCELNSVTSNAQESLFLLKIRYVACLDTIDFIFTDVTASKIALELKSELESKQKNFGKIAHEFKTPINSIIGLVNRSKEDLNKIKNANLSHNRKAKNTASRPRLDLSSIEAELNLIHNLSNYTIYLINDLIHFSSLHSSNAIVKINIETINLREIMEFCHNIAKALINCNQVKSSALKAVLQYDNHIQNFIIRSDEIRLKQMMLNLLSNSVKFTKRGQITLKAEISQARNSIVVSVIDTGLGIRKVDIDKLFGENVMLKLREQDRNMNRMGSGLGLSICKNFAKRLGMKISLETKMNVGSTFRLEIPCRAMHRMYTNESISLKASSKVVAEDSIKFSNKMTMPCNNTNTNLYKDAFPDNKNSNENVNLNNSRILNFNLKNELTNDINNKNENQNENFAEVFEYQSNFKDPLIHIKKSDTQFKSLVNTRLSNRLNDYDIIYYDDKKTIEINDECKNTLLSQIRRSTLIRELEAEMLHDQLSSRRIKAKKRPRKNNVISYLSSVNNEKHLKDLSVVEDCGYLSEEGEEEIEEMEEEEMKHQRSEYESESDTESDSELESEDEDFNQLEISKIKIIKANMTLEMQEKKEAKIDLNLSCGNVTDYLKKNFDRKKEGGNIQVIRSNKHLLQLTRIKKNKNSNESARNPTIKLKPSSSKRRETVNLINTNHAKANTSKSNCSREPSQGSSAALCTCPCFCNANKSTTDNNNLNAASLQAKVLIVDDNQFIRESFKKICREIMREKSVVFEIIEGNDGIDILSSIVANQANGLLKCTFTDENMEYFNGTEAIKLVRKLERENKISKNVIVSTTSYEDEASKNYIISAGADSIIGKPYSKNQILTMLRKFSIV